MFMFLFQKFFQAFLIFLGGICLFGQLNFNSKEVLKITYETKSNGNSIEKQDSILVFAEKDNFLLTTRNQWIGDSNFPFEFTFVNFKNQEVNLFSYLNKEEIIKTTDLESLSKQKFEILDETKMILGYKCQKAQTSINSNTIEVYFTKDLNVKGGPSILGSDLGLVLEFTRNGNFEIKATQIQKVNTEIPEYLSQIKPKELDKLTYNDLIWKSRFVYIPLFQNQQIHWSEEFEKREDVFRYANGTVVLKKIKFPKITSNQLLFLDLIEKSNGDAYDRTGSVFLIPNFKKQTFLDAFEKGIQSVPIYKNGNGKKYQGIIKTEKYEPLVELMRFFTPFGVNHFNERIHLKNKVWQDSVYYRQEITAYASLISEKEVYVGIFIGNYDKGGHTISANISIHNEVKTDESSNLKKVIPLFNTLNVLEMAGQEYSTLFDNERGLMVELELKENLNNAQLRYITTGHGGWENGDEFVPKKNTIIFNNKIIFDLAPWREDCGSYRLYNPVSGNFSNGLSSSDYSRSNWCPGTVTNPYTIDLGDLMKGNHIIQIKIPQGKPEGSSFSAWNISGVLIGN